MEEESREREYVCKFCTKKFPSGKSLGGHIRIHTSVNSVASDSCNGKNPKKTKKKNDKRLVDEREITALKQEQLKGFDSLKALSNHRYGKCEGEKMVMDSQSDTETCSGPTRKRSKRMMKQSNSESFSNGSSSSEISQADKNAALDLLELSMHRKKRNLVVNSLAESSENNSEILETKKSSGEELKMMKNQDKVAVDDQLRSAAADDDDDDGAILSDSYSSDSDYYMNGPKKSDSDTSVDGSPRNAGLGSGSNRFKNGDELGVKEGVSSKYELRKSKKVVLPSYESDSCAETKSKIHSKSPMVKKASGANKNSKGHECPICFKLFKSGQALGGHKRSHSFDSQEQRIKHKAAADMRIDLNFPAINDDE